MTVTGETGKVSLVTSAQRLASSRRSLMSLIGGEYGPMLALDQMGIPPNLVTSGNREFAQTVVRTEVENLRTAELFLADPDMCALLDTAAPTMPDQVLRPDDPIAPSGLLGFATPLPDRTGEGIPFDLHALSWMVLPDGHPLLAHRDTEMASASVLLVAYVATADVTRHLGGSEMKQGISRWFPNATVVWTIGTEIGTAFGRDPEQNHFTPGFYQRLAAAFWTLTRQPRIVDTEQKEPIPKKERRRYARAGIERPDEPVRLVRMTQRAVQSTSSSEPKPVNWRHSWIVRGHWRNVYLRSTDSHRQQFIFPFRKGPADKPLLGGEKVLLAPGKGVEPPTP